MTAQLAPLQIDPIVASAAATGALITLEEGTSGWSWGTEIAAEAGKRLFGCLRRPVEVVASGSDVIPSSRDRERDRLVGEEHIERAIRAVVAG